MKLLIELGLAITLASMPALALGQAWPNKPIHLVLGYTTGGAADGTARAFSTKLEASLGVPIIIDYKPGAGATVAAEAVAKSVPDGYTLHWIDSGPLTIVPHLRRVGYDPLASFTPITLGVAGGVAFVAHPSVPASNLQEMIALARANPGKYSYGTSGVGGAGHLAGELFKSVTQTDLVHVPYKGGAPAATELVGGQIPLLFSSMSTAVPYIKSGRIKAFAVTSPKRASALPDVPTMAEQGLAGFDATTWFALVGPAGLPSDIAAKIGQAFTKVLDDKQVQEAIRAQGYDPVTSTPAELQRMMREEYAKWGKVVREAGIKAE